jgi:hypothetical protein
VCDERAKFSIAAQNFSCALGRLDLTVLQPLAGIPCRRKNIHSPAFFCCKQVQTLYAATANWLKILATSITSALRRTTVQIEQHIGSRQFSSPRYLSS